jgi:hypothetical protein
MQGNHVIKCCQACGVCSVADLAFKPWGKQVTGIQPVDCLTVANDEQEGSVHGRCWVQRGEGKGGHQLMSALLSGKPANSSQNRGTMGITGTSKGTIGVNTQSSYTLKVNGVWRVDYEKPMRY